MTKMEDNDEFEGLADLSQDDIGAAKGFLDELTALTALLKINGSTVRYQEREGFDPMRSNAAYEVPPGYDGLNEAVSLGAQHSRALGEQLDQQDDGPLQPVLVAEGTPVELLSSAAAVRLGYAQRSDDDAGMEADGAEEEAMSASAFARASSRAGIGSGSSGPSTASAQARAQRLVQQMEADLPAHAIFADNALSDDADGSASSSGFARSSAGAGLAHEGREPADASEAEEVMLGPDGEPLDPSVARMLRRSRIDPREKLPEWFRDVLEARPDEAQADIEALLHMTTSLELEGETSTGVSSGVSNQRVSASSSSGPLQLPVPGTAAARPAVVPMELVSAAHAPEQHAGDKRKREE